jgi:hypothetical protein
VASTGVMISYRLSAYKSHVEKRIGRCKHREDNNIKMGVKEKEYQSVYLMYVAR